jgi:predicted ATPase/DNA-binding winged helix-turn-helix (wHTH) protein
MKPAWPALEMISFGPFRLVPSERLLTRAGTPVELGARALDILIAVVCRPNELVSKQDLLAQVWPDATVGEGSLRFHMANLRKALGDGEEGARYITTLVGRGYCFVAPISRPGNQGPDDRASTPAPGVASSVPANVPSRLLRMVGRTDGVRMLSTQLTSTRFVTIVGAGGVGKTTLAVAVAHHLIEAFAGTVLFIDLGALSDPKLAATSLASMLGLSVQSDDPIPGVIAYLRDKRILLILDNCEHLIDAAAALAARILVAALQVYILATSREALRVEGEHVHRLEPLGCPPDDPRLSAAAALTYPAVQLFLERAAASGAPLNLTDVDAGIVAGICRRLDGVALAIELAAARVEAHGLHQTAALLEERLSLLWQGQRTAPLRQQTLKATLDWSYQLLSGPERQVLRLLAVFVGDFTLQAALAVVTSETIDQMLVLGAIDSLVAKSMVATNHVGSTMRYRLLDTTRDYVLEIRGDDAEFADLATRHAVYYRQWLEQAGGKLPTSANVSDRAHHLSDLGNVRAALEWCFGANGNTAIGVGLASAATPVFLAMSLLTECHRWSEVALLALDDATRGGLEEMHLQAYLGTSLMVTHGSSEAARAAMNRGLAIAEGCGDALSQIQILGFLYMYHRRVEEPGTALRYARRSLGVARAAEDPSSIAIAQSLLGMSLHFIGDLGGARAELEAAVHPRAGPPRTGTIFLGFDGQSLAGSILARTLWLQGFPAQAVERARQAVTDAASIGHPVTLSHPLLWAISVLLWAGDLRGAEEHIDWSISWAESHSLALYRAIICGCRAELEIRRGDIKGGVEALQACLQTLRAARYGMVTTWFSISLAQGLAALGRVAEGMARVEAAIRLVEANGDFAYLPELLRVKGDILLSIPQPGDVEAEKCFVQSMELSRRQGARAWELRTAVDLAALLVGRGERENARALLRPVYEQFVEGLDTADLRAAERLLETLA